MELHQIIDQNVDQSTLLEKLHRYIRSLPFTPDLANQLLSLTPSNPETATVVKIFAIEALMYHSGPIDHKLIDDQFKQISSIGLKRSDSLSLLRTKYTDLLTDYQFLLSPDVRELKLTDLVSKKINLLGVEDDSLVLVHDIQLKVLVFYLLCGSDFRKKNIHKYLSDENVFSRDFPAAISNYVRYSLRGGIIPIDVYKELIDHLIDSVEFRSIYSRHLQQLLENFVETNLEKLPKYYKSIRLSRIQDLLLGGETSVDIEDVLFRMITSKKFAAATKIDQIEGLVVFGDNSTKYDGFNMHIKKVCDLVEKLTQ